MAQSNNEITASDLMDSQTYWVHYSRQQCLNLPPESVTSFEWKDYCPKVFRLIQDLENINNEYYMMLVCSDETIRKVSSTLRPGNMFLFSKDNRFAILTLHKSEVEILIEMLPGFYNHIKKFRSTVLNKHYGVHAVKPDRGAKVYFAVVANIFKSDLLMHRCYDLKGSLQGRKAEKMRFREKILHKDSDLDFIFYLEPLVRHRLLKQIEYDCAFLEAAGVMDYSLMLGLHIKGSPRGVLDARRAFSSCSQREGCVDNSCSDIDIGMSSASCYQSEMSPKTSTSSLQDSIHSRRELSFGDQWLPHNSDWLSCSDTFNFGEEMSARGVHMPKKEIGSRSSRENSKSRECYDVLLNFGIVDYFQYYSVTKRIEHAYKSLQFDRKMITAVNPKAYSSRFQDFMSEIFKADDSEFSQ